MELLVDTDAFCKLAVAGLLEDAIRLLGAALSDCRRLPALPHMLRRGRLRKKYGAEVCDRLVPLAESIPAIAQSTGAWLARLTAIEAIDPGEAQILAVAAEGGAVVLTDDKRALRAVKDVAGLPGALVGRIVVLENVLLALCDHIGANEVRQRIQPLRSHDVVVSVCFSDAVSNPRDGLQSYFQSIAAEVAPLVLWVPPPSRGKT